MNPIYICMYNTLKGIFDTRLCEGHKRIFIENHWTPEWDLYNKLSYPVGSACSVLKHSFSGWATLFLLEYLLPVSGFYRLAYPQRAWLLGLQLSLPSTALWPWSSKGFELPFGSKGHFLFREPKTSPTTQKCGLLTFLRPQYFITSCLTAWVSLHTTQEAISIPKWCWLLPLSRGTLQNQFCFYTTFSWEPKRLLKTASGLCT